MSEDLFTFLKGLYGDLKDSSIPTSRVVRKTLVLIVIAIFILAYHRHGVLGFGLWEPVFLTIGISFLVLFWGFIGGCFAGAIYEWFLQQAEVDTNRLSLKLYFIEWLFAIFSPLALLIIPFGGDGLIW